MFSVVALTETRTYLFTFTPPPPAPGMSSSILNYIIFFQKPKCFQSKRKHKDRFIFLFLILGARGKKSCLEMQLFEFENESNYFGTGSCYRTGMRCGQRACVSFNSWPACEVGGKILILQMKTPEREGEPV